MVAPAAVPANVPASMTTERALALFDSGEPVAVDDLRGFWRGSGLRTGHWLDPLLDKTGWVGKRFDSAERVHPLVHDGVFGRYFVNPDALPLGLVRRLRLGKWPLIRPASRLLGILLQTKKPKARLEMVDFRGKVSAAMVYTGQPITDHLRRFDENRLIGLMVREGEAAPCFFLLEREPPAG